MESMRPALVLRLRRRAHWKFLNPPKLDALANPFHTDVASSHGVFYFHLARKRRYIGYDSRGVERRVREYDGGSSVHSYCLPLMFLWLPQVLQTSLQEYLTNLRVDAACAEEIVRALLSSVSNAVDGNVREFYAFVDLEIVTVVDVVPGVRIIGELAAHYRSLVASEAVIKRLNEKTFVAEEATDIGTCSICLEDLSSSSEQIRRLVKMPCEHIFHVSCIVPWLKTKRTCPLCRRELDK
ncbi:E3 ubiquitin-protein ligase RING1-like [Punica granatum]|uniref:E3 ubiquitin-protein ligase RING1-like n=1 Tax=Punica granatum TaxID=22663 RepID=A0A218WXP1_PUNGR|nr:E3 ubiquitin-protein ligase RING1-like [Punica granatum]OWM77150.1 hypothetical protein CDL15_Pgr017684 [Punica granatum]